MNYHTIEEALDALRAGKCILVTDDPDRENEGDLYANECRKCRTVGFIANGTA